jgi:hypothetical protein
MQQRNTPHPQFAQLAACRSGSESIQLHKKEGAAARSQPTP